jgi:hypothetical protein
MKTTRRRAIPTILFAALVVSLTGCVNAEPEATEGVRLQLIEFEDQLNNALETESTPEGVWGSLDFSSPEGNPTFESSFLPQTGAPYPFAHEIGSTTLTLDVYVSSYRRDGGGIFTSNVQRYLCATYVVTPAEREFAREDQDCPDGAVSSTASQATLDELNLP